MAQVHNNTELTTALAGGDTTIELLGGDYSANVTISRGVTITLGAGVGAEDAKITGQWTINSAASVTIDGLLFVNETLAGDTGTFYSVQIQGAAAGVTHTISGSTFLREAPDWETAGSNNPNHYAIYVTNTVNATGRVVIDNNVITSANDENPYGPGVWRSGVWVTGTTNGVVEITENDFAHVRGALNAGTYSDSWLISGNSFSDAGTAIAFGNSVPGDLSKVTDNTFGENVDLELNLKGETGGVDLSDFDAAQFDDAGTYILGGAGLDTAVFNGSINTLKPFVKWDADGSGWLINYTGPTSFADPDGAGPETAATATAAALVGESMVVNVEKIVADNATFLLVGSGGFATIGAAIAAADPGDTIRIAAGTYTENVVISKADLTIIGDGDATIIQGTGINGSIGVNIQASGAAIQDIKVAGFHYDVRITGDVSDIVIDDVTFADAKVGLGKSTASDITGLTVKDSTFTDLVIGVDLPTASSEGRVTNLEFLDNAFTDITHKGFYAEALSNALLEGVTMTRVGQEGNDSGLNGNGIDINLKYDAYSDITIKDFTFVDVGGDDANGAAIAVKARNDGSTYGADPASFTGAVLIEGGSITGATVGVRAGEAGQTVADPAVKIVDVTINSSVADIDNRTTSTMTLAVATPLSVAGTSVGYIDDGVADVLTVGAGGTYSTITAALAAAHEGDTIKVAAGTYNESVVVNVANLTIEGADGVVIKGTFNADNGAFSGDLSDWIGTQLSYNGNSGAGVTVRADGFTLKDVKIDDFFQGVRFDTDVDDATLTDVDIENSLFGLHKTTTADVVGLTITRGSIVDGYQGTDFTKSTSSLTDGQLKDVNITGTLFQDLSAKGIYTEALADALITGITMTNVGVFGRGDSFGVIGEHGAGIDINLKSGSYSDITIQNFTFTDVGTSNGAGPSHNNAGAITIKARNDAPSYNANPATITDTVIIRNGAIDGTSTGIRVGEEGKTVSGPRVSVTDVKVIDFVDSTDHGAFINDTTSPMSVVFTSAGFIFDQGASSGVINFTPYTAPAPDPEPEEEEPAPPPPPPPPPPNPGQGPGAQLPDAIVESFDNVTGVDPTSEKASQPTIILPSGEEVPNPIYEEVLEMADLVAQLQAGLISEETVIDKMVEFATDTTAVALQAYQFFTGATPTKEGVTYLVNSDDNENDLTDPYYATFSPDNRYINFAVSLGTGGEGAANFEAEYGQLSFEDAVKSAYDTIIGLDNAEAAGINVTEAIAYVMAQLAYFTALGGTALGAKAAMVGFLMFAGMNAKVGVYYDGTRGFLADAFNGEADYNVDLTGGAGSGGFTSSGLELGLA
ncbi:hypothetical protein [Caulobacter sp. NIBR2454]|uniref:hypothetical protein n=1 Tax=Caulobacter sp. NIBR2454 TaxID=3015996 RepID=UPI0022B5F47D|nr:hypothetical protein [Caulobacter sp. NIBR2454]